MLTITSGSVLTPHGFAAQGVSIAHGAIVDGTGDGRRIDASGLMVLPGLVDIHGDAFERQIMPRPGVSFDLRTALADTDRQLVANGITTACHGVTSSWEPGLRGIENARALVRALSRLRGRTACDMRLHLRHETFNLAAVDETLGWIVEGYIQALAFNDHMRGIVLGKTIKASKLKTMVERSGLSEPDFMALVERILSRETEISGSLERLAACAAAHGVPLLSHDDRNLDDRAAFRALGCRISEFPMSPEVARDAIQAGERTVFGAPNVLRGGSHIGCPSAADMAAEGLCSILSSDYYYPALLAAPFRLAGSARMPLEQAWRLVSAHPAAALGLSDRGEIAAGLRADIVLVEAQPEGPRLVATICGGEIAWLSDWRRLA
jgi:alpha-D-ribose 1-methylphosphonate 5-triphosphate diphosphatase